MTMEDNNPTPTFLVTQIYPYMRSMAFTCVYIYMCAPMCVHVCTRVYMFVHLCSCMIHMCTYVHPYQYMYMNAHVSAHVYKCAPFHVSLTVTILSTKFGYLPPPINFILYAFCHDKGVIYSFIFY